MPDDPKLTHAREFTDIEDLTLDLWLQLELANLDDNARRLLDAGLMFEHYTSLLDNDPGKRSLQELQQQQQLGFKLSDEIRLAQEALRQKAGKAGAVFTRRHISEGVIDERQGGSSA